MNENMLSVTVADGKYTVIQDHAGRASALRYGQPWRDCVGDGLILSLAYTVSDLRDRISKLEAFISDLQEIEFNDTDASYWRRESIRIPSGETLYVGGSKPK